MLKALRTKRAGLVAEMRGIIETAETEDRDLTAEETTTYDAKKSELDQLDLRIARAEAVETAEAEGDAVIPAAGRGNGPGRQQRGPEAKTQFENFGEFLAAVRFNPDDQRLTFVEGVGAGGDDPEIRGEFRMDNDTQGGFMVPPQLRTTIMQVEPQDALVRPRATVIPAGSPPDSSVTVPALDQTGAGTDGSMFGGIQVAWIGEGEEKPETDATLRNITLTPHEVAGFVTITDKLLRNWQAASAFVETLLRGGVSAAEDYAFLRGTGVHQPLGVINSGALKTINRAVANQVSYVDLVNMVARLLMRGGTSPIWSMAQSVLPQIALLTDPEGHYIWKPDARDGFAEIGRAHV